MKEVFQKEVNATLSYPLDLPESGLYSITIKASVKPGWRNRWWLKFRRLLEEIIDLHLDDEDLRVEFHPETKAEDENYYSWYTFALVNQPLKYLSISASANISPNGADDDDLKLTIDGRVRRNPLSRHKDSLFCGFTLKGKEHTFTEERNLGAGTHFIELFADKVPTLNSVVLKFNRPLSGKAKIALYKDIGGIDSVNLRGSPNHLSADNILENLSGGQEIYILEERVKGTYVENRSDIWHKVSFNGKEGYILSSFVEIFGQERSTIIEKIQKVSTVLGADPDLMTALAGCESRFKPYAVSAVQAKGVFQLTESALSQLRKIGFEIVDPFDSDRNIEGGIRYFLWLWQTFYRGEDDASEKALAAYNWGQSFVPSKEPFNVADLPGEPRRLVSCVLGNKGGKPWSHISILVLLFLAAGFLLFSSANKDGKGSLLSKKTNAGEIEPSLAAGGCPKIISNEKTRVISLFGRDCKEVKIFPWEKFPPDAKDISQWKDRAPEWIFSPVVGEEVSSAGKDTIYFLVSHYVSCGLQNCTYTLYSYDTNTDTIKGLLKNVSGAAVKLYSSPSTKIVAIVRHIAGGVCNTGAYIDLFDSGKGLARSFVGWQDEEFENVRVEKFRWLSDKEIEFNAIHSAGCDPAISSVRHKKFTYSIDTGNLKSVTTREL